MKDRNKSLLALLLVIAVLAVGGAVAWFTFNQTDTVNVGTGQVVYSVQNTIAEQTDVLPGETLPDSKGGVGTVTISNTSTRETFLRVKADVAGSTFYEGTDTFSDVFSMAGDISNSSVWVKHGNWYYFVGPVTATTSTISLIDSISVLGTVGNEYQNKTFKIVVTVDAIQGTEAALRSEWIGAGSDKITQLQAEALGYLPSS